MRPPSSPNSRLVLAALLGWAFMPGTAAAVELWGTGWLAGSTLKVNNDFEIRYYSVDRELEGFEDRAIHDYVEQVDRLNMLVVSPRGFTIGAQIDQVALYSNRYILNDDLYRSNILYDPEIVSPWEDALIVGEKLYFQKNWKNGEVRVGDGYGSFGRGIALNITKLTDIDVDTSIFGAQAKVSSGNMDFKAITGISNKQQIAQDNPNLLIDQDPNHMVSGIRGDVYGLGPINIGAHGVIYRFGRAEDEDLPKFNRYAEPLDAVAGGLGIEAMGIAGIDWYIEGDVFEYRSPELTGEAEGQSSLAHAVYLSASTYAGRSTFLLEAKDSSETERLQAFTTAEGWEVSNTPTLEYERVITEDSSAAVNSNDITGGRLRWDYAAKPGELITYLSAAGFRDQELGGLHFNRSPETIAHGVAGVQLHKGKQVIQTNAGYRYELRDDPADGADRLAHVDAEFHVPVGDNAIEVAIGAKQFGWGNNINQQADFFEMENALVWHQGHKWQFVLYQDYSDNPLINSEGNVTDKVYGALEVKYQASAQSTLKAFYGAYKAGIRCSGGQCRSLPGFDGGRFAWTTEF